MTTSGVYQSWRTASGVMKTGVVAPQLTLCFNVRILRKNALIKPAYIAHTVLRTIMPSIFIAIHLRAYLRQYFTRH